MMKAIKKEAKRPETTKKLETAIAGSKSEAVFLHTVKNPSHEMMITTEKIKSEKKFETKNVKSGYSFNPKNS